MNKNVVLKPMHITSTCNGTMDYQALVQESYEEVQSAGLQGKPAEYIPELKDIDIDQFGVSLIENNGNIYKVGDADVKFSIQSISKVFALTLVISKIGKEVWQRVGVEPSGNPFNSFAQLESENGIPRNPFINAGALAITDVMTSLFPRPLDSIIEFTRSISQTEDINYNLRVARSELEKSSRNTALCYLMKSFDNINSSVRSVIETYCCQCALEMSCVELAQAFQLYANHGKNIYTGERILTTSQSKRINAVMLTCGFYDESGDFAFRVGLPGKSGVGGGICAVLPGKFSVTVWSPGLNEHGNSVKGIKFLEILTTKLGHSIF